MRALSQCLVIKQEPAIWLQNIQQVLFVFDNLANQSLIADFSEKLNLLLTGQAQTSRV